jgi:hypothetical protein
VQVQHAAVGGPEPGGMGGGPPGAAGPGLQVQRPELIGADHPPISGRVVIQIQHAVHLGDEVRVGGGLPGFGGLPAHPARMQDLGDGFTADRGDTCISQVFRELA